MAFFTDGAAVGAPGEVHATALNPVGVEREANDGNVYVYLPGVASCVAGSWATVHGPAGVSTQVTALLTVSAKGPVRIATGAFTAGTWGWWLARGWYSGAHAGSNGTIVSGGGALQAEEASGGTGRVALGVSAGAGTFLFGAYSYSAQPDTDSVATGTPGIDQIVVFIDRPIASVS